MKFFSSLMNKHHIVLKKGQNLHIVWTLLCNQVLDLKLQLYKWLHGIRHPIVHYYALCWNEEKMLPFMFDHYEPFVDKFVIYDNFSTDNSEVIINTHLNTEIKKYNTEGKLNDIIYINIKNNCWKKSRGKADYVIVCDIDEFFYHPEIEIYLKQMRQHRWTITRPQGFEMYSEHCPKYDSKRRITDIVRMGVASHWYNKSILFDPHRIVEVNYEPGCHSCYPVGCVYPSDDKEIKLLHYKNLGVDTVIERYRECAERLSETNIKNQFGSHYLWKEEEIKSKFYNNLKVSFQVI